MLLGVRLWYAFCGSVLSSEMAFEGKIEELCRELGDCRGTPELLVVETAVAVAPAVDVEAVASSASVTTTGVVAAKGSVLIAVRRFVSRRWQAALALGLALCLLANRRRWNALRAALTMGKPKT